MSSSSSGKSPEMDKSETSDIPGQNIQPVISGLKCVANPVKVPDMYLSKLQGSGAPVRGLPSTPDKRFFVITPDQLKTLGFTTTIVNGQTMMVPIPKNATAPTLLPAVSTITQNLNSKSPHRTNLETPLSGFEQTKPAQSIPSELGVSTTSTNVLKPQLATQHLSLGQSRNLASSSRALEQSAMFDLDWDRSAIETKPVITSNKPNEIIPEMVGYKRALDEPSTSLTTQTISTVSKTRPTASLNIPDNEHLIIMPPPGESTLITEVTLDKLDYEDPSVEMNYTVISRSSDSVTMSVVTSPAAHSQTKIPPAPKTIPLQIQNKASINLGSMMTAPESQPVYIPVRSEFAREQFPKTMPKKEAMKPTRFEWETHTVRTQNQKPHSPETLSPLHHSMTSIIRRLVTSSPVNPTSFSVAHPVAETSRAFQSPQRLSVATSPGSSGLGTLTGTHQNFPTSPMFISSPSNLLSTSTTTSPPLLIKLKQMPPDHYTPRETNQMHGFDANLSKMESFEFEIVTDEDSSHESEQADGIKLLTAGAKLSPRRRRVTKKRRMLSSFTDYWNTSLQENGFIRCPLRACNYISLHYRDMSTHYAYCTGSSTVQTNMCHVCAHRLGSERDLLDHMAISHSHTDIYKRLLAQHRVKAGKLGQPSPVRRFQVSPHSATQNHDLDKQRRPLLSPNKTAAPGRLNTNLIINKPAKPDDEFKLFRKRSYSAVHKTCWRIAIESKGYVKCFFQNCNFLALNMEDMVEHYGVCNGSDMYSKFMCPFCNGGLKSLEMLHKHISMEHMEESHAWNSESLSREDRTVTDSVKSVCNSLLSKSRDIEIVPQKGSYIISLKKEPEEKRQETFEKYLDSAPQLNLHTHPTPAIKSEPVYSVFDDPDQAYEEVEKKYDDMTKDPFLVREVDTSPIKMEDSEQSEFKYCYFKSSTDLNLNKKKDLKMYRRRRSNSTSNSDSDVRNYLRIPGQNVGTSSKIAATFTSPEMDRSFELSDENQPQDQSLSAASELYQQDFFQTNMNEKTNYFEEKEPSQQVLERKINSNVGTGITMTQTATEPHHFSELESRSVEIKQKVSQGTSRDGVNLENNIHLLTSLPADLSEGYMLEPRLVQETNDPVVSAETPLVEELHIEAVEQTESILDIKVGTINSSEELASSFSKSPTCLFGQPAQGFVDNSGLSDDNQRTSEQELVELDVENVLMEIPETGEKNNSNVTPSSFDEDMVHFTVENQLSALNKTDQQVDQTVLLEHTIIRDVDSSDKKQFQNIETEQITTAQSSTISKYEPDILLEALPKPQKVDGTQSDYTTAHSSTISKLNPDISLDVLPKPKVDGTQLNNKQSVYISKTHISESFAEKQPIYSNNCPLGGSLLGVENFHREANTGVLKRTSSLPDLALIENKYIEGTLNRSTSLPDIVFLSVDSETARNVGTYDLKNVSTPLDGNKKVKQQLYLSTSVSKRSISLQDLVLLPEENEVEPRLNKSVSLQDFVSLTQHIDFEKAINKGHITLDESIRVDGLNDCTLNNEVEEEKPGVPCTLKRSDSLKDLILIMENKAICPESHSCADLLNVAFMSANHNTGSTTRSFLSKKSVSLQDLALNVKHNDVGHKNYRGSSELSRGVSLQDLVLMTGISKTEQELNTEPDELEQSVILQDFAVPNENMAGQEIILENERMQQPQIKPLTDPTEHQKELLLIELSETNVPIESVNFKTTGTGEIQNHLFGDSVSGSPNTESAGLEILTEITSHIEETRLLEQLQDISLHDSGLHLDAIASESSSGKQKSVYSNSELLEILQGDIDVPYQEKQPKLFDGIQEIGPDVRTTSTEVSQLKSSSIVNTSDEELFKDGCFQTRISGLEMESGLSVNNKDVSSLSENVEDLISSVDKINDFIQTPNGQCFQTNKDVMTGPLNETSSASQSSKEIIDNDQHELTHKPLAVICTSDDISKHEEPECGIDRTRKVLLEFSESSGVEEDATCNHPKLGQIIKPGLDKFPTDNPQHGESIKSELAADIVDVPAGDKTEPHRDKDLGGEPQFEIGIKLDTPINTPNVLSEHEGEEIPQLGKETTGNTPLVKSTKQEPPENVVSVLPKSEITKEAQLDEDNSYDAQPENTLESGPPDDSAPALPSPRKIREPFLDERKELDKSKEPIGTSGFQTKKTEVVNVKESSLNTTHQKKLDKTVITNIVTELAQRKGLKHAKQLASKTNGSKLKEDSQTCEGTGVNNLLHQQVAKYDSQTISSPQLQKTKLVGDESAFEIKEDKESLYKIIPEGNMGTAIPVLSLQLKESDSQSSAELYGERGTKVFTESSDNLKETQNLGNKVKTLNTGDVNVNKTLRTNIEKDNYHGSKSKNTKLSSRIKLRVQRGNNPKGTDLKLSRRLLLKTRLKNKLFLSKLNKSRLKHREKYSELIKSRTKSLSVATIVNAEKNLHSSNLPRSNTQLDNYESLASKAQSVPSAESVTLVAGQAPGQNLAPLIISVCESTLDKRLHQETKQVSCTLGKDTSGHIVSETSGDVAGVSPKVEELITIVLQNSDGETIVNLPNVIAATPVIDTTNRKRKQNSNTYKYGDPTLNITPEASAKPKHESVVGEIQDKVMTRTEMFYSENKLPKKKRKLAKIVGANFEGETTVDSTDTTNRELYTKITESLENQTNTLKALESSDQTVSNTAGTAKTLFLDRDSDNSAPHDLVDNLEVNTTKGTVVTLKKTGDCNIPEQLKKNHVDKLSSEKLCQLDGSHTSDKEDDSHFDDTELDNDPKSPVDNMSNVAKQKKIKVIGNPDVSTAQSLHKIDDGSSTSNAGEIHCKIKDMGNVSKGIDCTSETVAKSNSSSNRSETIGKKRKKMTEGTNSNDVKSPSLTFKKKLKKHSHPNAEGETNRFQNPQSDKKLKFVTKLKRKKSFKDDGSYLGEEQQHNIKSTSSSTNPAEGSSVNLADNYIELKVEASDFSQREKEKTNQKQTENTMSNSESEVPKKRKKMLKCNENKVSSTTVAPCGRNDKLSDPSTSGLDNILGSESTPLEANFPLLNTSVKSEVLPLVEEGTRPVQVINVSILSGQEHSLVNLKFKTETCGNDTHSCEQDLPRCPMSDPTTSPGILKDERERVKSPDPEIKKGDDVPIAVPKRRGRKKKIKIDLDLVEKTSLKSKNSDVSDEDGKEAGTDEDEKTYVVYTRSGRKTTMRGRRPVARFEKDEDERDTDQQVAAPVVRGRGRGRPRGRPRGRGRGRGAMNSSGSAVITPGAEGFLDSSLEDAMSAVARLQDDSEVGKPHLSAAYIALQKKRMKRRKKGKRIGRKSTGPLLRYDEMSESEMDIMGKCAKCQKEMLKGDFLNHSLHKHTGMAWMEGEEPFDFEDEKILTYVVTRAWKMKIPLRCEFCLEFKRSVVGFISHIQFCQKTSEERDAMMVACDICDRVMMPSSLKVHLPTHRISETAKFSEEVQTKTTPTGKRAAAAKAISKLQDFVQDEGDEPEEEQGNKKKRTISPNFAGAMYTTKTTELEKRHLTTWKRNITISGKATCRNVACKFESGKLEELKKHFISCPHTQKKGFYCKKCKFFSEAETVMEKHVTGAHNKAHSDDEGTDDDDNSNSNISGEEIEEVEAKIPKVKEPSVVEIRNFKNRVYSKMKFLVKQRSGSVYGDKPYMPTIKWTLNYRKKYYTTTGLFPELHSRVADWHALGPVEVEEYLPITRESPSLAQVCIRKRFSDPKTIPGVKFKKLKLFEGQLVDGVPTLFAGGPVWGMAWCSIPMECLLVHSIYKVNVHQFLAVSCHRSMDDLHKTGSSYSNKGLIQIWDFGHLDNLRKCSMAPKLVLGLAHEFGAIWQLEWCPSGCYDVETPEDRLRRLGLLAAACSDGTVRIFSVCFPDQLLETHADNAPLFKTEPAVTLVLDPVDKVKLGGNTYQCTRISWFKGKNHSILAGGFSNGMVALWDLTTESSFLRRVTGAAQTLSPYMTFEPHIGAVTALSLSPFEDGRYLMTGSADCTTKVWDLDDVTIPVSFGRKGLVTDGLWLQHWVAHVTSFDDAYSMTHTNGTLSTMRNFGYSLYPLLAQNSVAWSVSSCEWLNGMAQATHAGELAVIFPHQLLMSVDTEKGMKNKRIMVSYTEIKDITSADEDNAQDNEPQICSVANIPKGETDTDTEAKIKTTKRKKRLSYQRKRGPNSWRKTLMGRWKPKNLKDSSKLQEDSQTKSPDVAGASNNVVGPAESNVMDSSTIDGVAASVPHEDSEVREVKHAEDKDFESEKNSDQKSSVEAQIEPFNVPQIIDNNILTKQNFIINPFPESVLVKKSLSDGESERESGELIRVKNECGSPLKISTNSAVISIQADLPVVTDPSQHFIPGGSLDILSSSLEMDVSSKVHNQTTDETETSKTPEKIVGSETNDNLKCEIVSSDVNLTGRESQDTDSYKRECLDSEHIDNGNSTTMVDCVLSNMRVGQETADVSVDIPSTSSSVIGLDSVTGAEQAIKTPSVFDQDESSNLSELLSVKDCSQPDAREEVDEDEASMAINDSIEVIYMTDITEPHEIGLREFRRKALGKNKKRNPRDKSRGRKNFVLDEAEGHKDFLCRPRTYNEAVKKHGVILCDFPTDQFENIPEEARAWMRQSEKMRVVPIDMFPLVSINRVSWNPNCRSFLWLASGYHCGLVRVPCFRGMHQAAVEKYLQEAVPVRSNQPSTS